MNAGSISISMIRSDLGLNASFPEAADSIFNSESDNGDLKTKSAIEVSDEGDHFILDFDKAEYDGNSRVMNIVTFSATYLPGEDMMRVDAESDDNADDLYQLFKGND